LACRAEQPQEEIMALVLNEEQQMLRDAARDFLTQRAPISHLRQLRDGGNEIGFSRELWAEMVEMGWSAILIPEEHGGLGYGYTGLGLVLEESGRTLTPSPLLGTALTGAAALLLAGSPEQCAAFLPEVATGERILALACDELSNHAPEHVETRAERRGDGYLLDGRKIAVLDGAAADTLIASASAGAGISLFLVPASTPGVTIEPYPSLDISVAADITFKQVELPASALLGSLDESRTVLDRVLDIARIGTAAEMLGIAQEAFERTMDYLRERKQFGVPIGSFQALQHRAAQLHAEIEMSRSVVIKALQTLDEGAEDCAELASLAKAKLSTTAHRSATEAIQMHGGIGVTDDFDIGFFLKRCRILETLYGDRNFHLDRYARLRGY
jgi:alkylation response protein AidB-like acyl-CoA dehydrogenase